LAAISLLANGCAAIAERANATLRALYREHAMTQHSAGPGDGASARHVSGVVAAATGGSALDSFSTFEQWARDYYEPAAERHYDRAIARLLRRLDPPPGATILDAGCGTGVHSVRVARAGHRVKAVDISAVALNDARRRAAECGLASRIDFERGNITALPYEDATFDAIFSWGVIVHVRDVDAALRELVRVLKPGGRVGIELSNMRSLDCMLESAARALLRRPPAGAERSRFGIGWWGKMSGGQLWTWRMNVREVVAAMNDLGCRCAHRAAGDFTELQRRAGGPLRPLLRLANDTWTAFSLPAAFACTNVLVFEKSGAG
jgi:SAM-dependent methyltransferase